LPAPEALSPELLDSEPVKEGNSKCKKNLHPEELLELLKEYTMPA
jgi:hypothetical protein